MSYFLDSVFLNKNTETEGNISEVLKMLPLYKVRYFKETEM